MSHSLERRPDADPRAPGWLVPRLAPPPIGRPSAPAAPLTREEMRSLAAVCDALLPPPFDTPWRQTAANRAADLLARGPSQDEVARFRLFLALVELPPAQLVASGRWAGFSSLDRGRRERALHAMAMHPLPAVRTGFQVLKRLTMVAYFADASPTGTNPVWGALGYPGPTGTTPSSTSGPRVPSSRPTEDTLLDCDVVVVGSGAGGGMVAAELAAAGVDVVVLERGGHFESEDFQGLEVQGLRDLYLGSGLTGSKDHGVQVLAGSCLGGGTVVNYTTSLRLPEDVRAEWARVSGLNMFTEAEFARSLDAAWDALGVNEVHGLPSTRDAILERGLHALGWHVSAVPRNVAGCTQDEVCGSCGFGCVRGAKRSSLATGLRTAVDHGARLFTRCRVDSVQRERGRATGVVASTPEGFRVTVRAARAVVVAAGAIHTPALLLRSEVEGPIGHNLRLHPVTAVWGRFPELVQPWTGTLQARYSDQLADLHQGYGVRLETAPIHPGFLAAGAAWEDPMQFGRLMRALPYTSVVGLLNRDRYGGRVGIDRRGHPTIDYAVSRYDQRHVRGAVRAAAQVLAAAGAEEIFTSQARYVRFRPAADSLEGWLARADRVGYGPNQTLYASFHQMGTARMGINRRDSVVNGEGQVHAVRDLYVADASLFPTASGVNPMVTVTALAHHVAQALKARL